MFNKVILALNVIIVLVYSALAIARNSISVTDGVIIFINAFSILIFVLNDAKDEIIKAIKKS